MVVGNIVDCRWQLEPISSSQAAQQVLGEIAASTPVVRQKRGEELGGLLHGTTRLLSVLHSLLPLAISGECPVRRDALPLSDPQQL